MNILNTDFIYSENETKTAKTWIDGSPIYRKTIFVPQLANTSNVETPHRINNLKEIIKITGFMKRIPDDGFHCTLPLANSQSPTANINISANETGIQINSGNDRTSFKAYITIEYTKKSN